MQIIAQNVSIVPVVSLYMPQDMLVTISAIKIKVSSFSRINRFQYVIFLYSLPSGFCVEVNLITVFIVCLSFFIANETSIIHCVECVKYLLRDISAERSQKKNERTEYILKYMEIYIGDMDIRLTYMR